MISYDPLWKTMKEKNVSTYALLKNYQFSRGTLHSLKKNKNVTTATLNTLCTILSCDIEDILCYVPEEQ